jgi:hypothetical protein
MNKRRPGWLTLRANFLEDIKLDLPSGTVTIRFIKGGLNQAKFSFHAPDNVVIYRVKREDDETEGRAV